MSSVAASRVESILDLSELSSACRLLRVIQEALECLRGSGQSSRGSKRDKLKALATIDSRLHDSSVCNALTLCSRRESIRGIRDETTLDSTFPNVNTGPLSWRDLMGELIEAVAVAVDDAGKSRAKSLPLRPEYMRTFRHAIKTAILRSAPSTLAENVLRFTHHVLTWFRNSKLSDMWDDAWLCLVDMLEVDDLRARLSFTVYRKLVDTCFQQIAQRGSKFRHSLVATNAAMRLLCLMSTETYCGNVLLLRKSSGKSTWESPFDTNHDTVVDSESVGRDRILPAFVYVLQRCCLLLKIANKMETSQCREVESAVLTAMTQILSSRAVELYGSIAVESVVEYAIPATLACWKERRHKAQGVEFLDCLVSLLPRKHAARQVIWARVRDDLIPTYSAKTIPETDISTAVSLSRIASNLLESQDAFGELSSVANDISDDDAHRWFLVLERYLERQDSADLKRIPELVSACNTVYSRACRGGRTLSAASASAWCRVLSRAGKLYARLSETHFLSFEKTRRSAHVPIDDATWSQAYVNLVQYLGNTRNGTRAPRGVTKHPSRVGNAEDRVLNAMTLLLQLRLPELAVVSFLGAGTAVGRSKNDSMSLTGLRDTLWMSPVFNRKGTISSATCRYIRAHLRAVGLSDTDGGTSRTRILHLLLDVCAGHTTVSVADSRSTPPCRDGYMDAGVAMFALIHGSCEGEDVGEDVGEDDEPEDYSKARKGANSEAYRCLRAVRTLYGEFSAETSHGYGRIVADARKLETARPRVLRDFFGFRALPASCAEAMGLVQVPAWKTQVWERSPGDMRMHIDAQLQSRAEGALEKAVVDSCLGLLTDDTERAEDRCASDVHKEKAANMPFRIERALSDSENDAISGTGSAQRRDELETYLLSSDLDLQMTATEALTPLSAKLSVRLVKSVGAFLVQSLLERVLPSSLPSNSPLLTRSAPRSCGVTLLKVFAYACESLSRTDAKLLFDENLNVDMAPCLSVLARVLAQWSANRQTIPSLAGSHPIYRCLRESLDRLVRGAIEHASKVVDTWSTAVVDVVCDAQSAYQDLGVAEGSTKRNQSSSSVAYPSRKRRRIEFDKSDSNHSEKDPVGLQDDNDDNEFAEPVHPDDSWESPEKASRSVRPQRTPTLRGLATSEKTPIDSIDAGTVSDLTSRTLQFLSGVRLALVTTMSILPETRDRIANDIASILRSVSTRENNKLGSDGYARHAVQCVDVGSTYIDVLENLWGVLEAAGTTQAMSDLATDIIRCSTSWKGARSMTIELQSAYEQEFGGAASGPGALPRQLEEGRMRLLVWYTNLFWTRVACDRKERSQPYEYSLGVDDNVLLNALRCALSLSDVDGAPLPVTSRRVALEMLIAARESLAQRPHTSEQDYQQERLDFTQRVSEWLRLALHDSDGCIRVRAARCARLADFAASQDPAQNSHAPGNLHSDFLPIAVCKEPEGLLETQEATKTDPIASTSAEWGLSDDEAADVARMHLRFSCIGRTLNGSAAFIGLAELALESDLDRGTILGEVFERARLGCGNADVALGSVFRITWPLRFQNPMQLFQAHRHEILARLLGSDPVQGVEKLNMFPVGLVCNCPEDKNHDAQNIVYDNIDALLPYVCTRDDSNTLMATRKLAEFLDMDVGALLKQNTEALYRLYPMHFQSSTNSTGSQLWKELSDSAGPAGLLPKTHEEVESLLCAMLMSCTPSKPSVGDGPSPSGKQVFVRQPAEAKAPEYDPIVCIEAMNYASSGGGGGGVPIVRVDHMRGSVFDSQREKTSDSISKVLRQNRFLVSRMVDSIWHGLHGPPCPPCSWSRRRAFMSLGALYYVGVEALTSTRATRLSLCRLIVQGIRFPDTASDAKWLLAEFLSSISGWNLSEDQEPEAHALSSQGDCSTDLYDNNVLSPFRFEDSLERRWNEVFEATVPELVSVASGALLSSLNRVAAEDAQHALNLLVEGAVAQNAHRVVALTDSFPEGKAFRRLRKTQTSARRQLLLENSPSTESHFAYMVYRMVQCPSDILRFPTTALSRLRVVHGYISRNFSELAKEISNRVRLSQSDFDVGECLRLGMTSASELAARVALSEDAIQYGRCEVVASHTEDDIALFLSTASTIKEECARVVAELGKLLQASGSNLCPADARRVNSRMDADVHITSLALAERNSRCSVTRRAALFVLPRFLANISRSKLRDRLPNFDRDCKLYADYGKKRKLGAKSGRDALWFRHLVRLPDGDRPKAEDEALWDWSRCRTEGVHSCAAWVREVATTICNKCSPQSGYNQLAPLCSSSSTFAEAMLPLLMAEVVHGSNVEEELLMGLTNGIRAQLVSQSETPEDVLRILVQCVDRLCDIGLDNLATTGYRRSLFTSSGKRRTEAIEYMHSLNIPYIELARASSRCGLHCSAARFVFLHMEHCALEAERSLLAAGSTGTSLVADVASAKQVARLECEGILRDACVFLDEPDSLRANIAGQSLIERTGTLAALESNWSLALGVWDACQAHTQSKEKRPAGGTEFESHGAGVSFVRERNLVQSFVGIGAFGCVEDRWNGLRARLASGAECCALGSSDTGIAERVAVDDLVELRHQTAWLLGQWELPPGLGVQRTSNDGESRPGVHERIHRSLIALRLGDPGSARDEVSSARGWALRKILGETRGYSFVRLRNAVSSFQLLDDVELACAAVEEVQRSGREGPLVATEALAASQDGGTSGAVEAHMTGGAPRPGSPYEDWIYGRLNRSEATKWPEGLNVSKLRIEGGHSSETAYATVEAAWRMTPGDWSSIHLRPSAEAIDERTVTALSLRRGIALAFEARRGLHRASATLAEALLRGTQDRESWARAASAMALPDPANLKEMSKYEVGTWAVTEAELVWRASEDGGTREQALRSVTSAVHRTLGGAIDATSGGTENGNHGFVCSWGDGDYGAPSEEALGRLRARACSLAAFWSASMRADDPLTLYSSYLTLGLSAFGNSATGSSLCDMHYRMAQFADHQLRSVEEYIKSSRQNSAIASVPEQREELELFASKIRDRALPGVSDRDARRYIRDVERELRRSEAKEKRLEELHSEWQRLAAKHYISTLRSGSSHDLRAAFRFVSIWLDSGEHNDELNKLLISGDRSQAAFGETALTGSLEISTSKILPLAPQIVSRLATSTGSLFERSLATVVAELARAHFAHCSWLLIALSNTDKTPPESMAGAPFYTGNMHKKNAAEQVLNLLRRSNTEEVEQTFRLANYYASLSELSATAQKLAKRAPDDARCRQGLHIMKGDLCDGAPTDLGRVPVASLSLPLNGYSNISSVPTVQSFLPQYRILGGKSRPIRVECIGSDGILYSQVVKYADDLRQDATMQQLFVMVNRLLTMSQSTIDRNLIIRTYRVVPLSPFDGFLQFVPDSQAFREYLVDNDASGNNQVAAHTRLRPHDTKHSVIWEKAGQLHRQSESVRVAWMRKIWPTFLPVFRYFFLERFHDPEVWFDRRLRYTRSVAVMSIVGWIVGLGDRHLSNILIDKRTAEAVHIDFGIAFEQGKLLPTPEKMPFRLSRDVIDGMGIDGVEGTFRRCCEATLNLMRQNKDLLVMIIEVLLHDPLYNWTLSPRAIVQQHEDVQENVSREDDNDDPPDADLVSVRSTRSTGSRKRVPGDEATSHRSDRASRALARISEKLDGLEETERLSVEAHVARLIDQARSFEVLASVYCGWMPWV